MVDCSISIVNFNTRDFLERCINSILEFVQEVSYEIIVVDNASTDKSVEAIKQKFPQVQIIENKENLFFTKACNQGLRASSGRYLFPLNPDCYFEDNAVAAMVKFMDQNPKVGACGPIILNPDGTIQSLGHHFPGLLYPFFELLFLNTVFPRNPVRQARNYRESKLQEIDAAGGGSIMVSRKVIETAGLLDEGFLMYFEDTDWCKRIRNAGWSIMHLPMARLFHFGGQATVKMDRSKFEKILFQSMLYYYRKYYGFFVSFCIRIILFSFHYPLLYFVRFLKRNFMVKGAAK